MFRKNTNRYTTVLRSYFRWLLKDAITNPDYTEKDTLEPLQAKYRLELNSDVNDMLYDTAERVIENLKSQAGAYGDVLLWHDNYYMKRKKDLVGMVEDMLGENSQIDVGKYAEKLISHLMPTAERKFIKLDGKSTGYYALNLKPYHATEEEAVISQFENLDEETF